MFSLQLGLQATYTLMALVPRVLQLGALAFAIWVDSYAHILDEDCKVNAQKFEAAFYARADTFCSFVPI